MSSLPPDAVTHTGGAYEVDASVLSQRLGLSVEHLRREMRRGFVVSKLEKGIGEDAGRTRLTFRYYGTVWSIVINPNGTLTEAPVVIVPLKQQEGPATSAPPAHSSSSDKA